MIQMWSDQGTIFFNEEIVWIDVRNSVVSEKIRRLTENYELGKYEAKFSWMEG